jgi:hypothetical protein
VDQFSDGIYNTLRDITADCQAAALVADIHQAESAARLLREIPSCSFANLGE